MTVMCFGDAALAVQKFRTGCVLQVISPKLLRSGGEGKQQGVAFCIDSEAQLQLIGYSEDFDVCSGKTNMPGASSDMMRCRAFLNKSVETICDKHKFERNLMKLDRQKGSRLALQSNTVDVHAIRKMQKMQDMDAGIGAFGGKKNLARDNRPIRMLTPEEAAQQQ